MVFTVFSVRVCARLSSFREEEACPVEVMQTENSNIILAEARQQLTAGMQTQHRHLHFG